MSRSVSRRRNPEGEQRRFVSVAVGLAASIAVSAVLGMGVAAAQEEVVVPDGLQVTTDYPAVTVRSGDTISFDIDVLAPRPEPVALSVIDVPDGWEANLRGGGFEINGVTPDPDSPPRAELELVVPAATDPGIYRLGVMARGDGEADELDLAITVADRPIGGITLSTDFAGLRGRPGDTFRYDLQITNQTPDEITFAFDGRGPQGWSVTAGPASEQRASTVTVAAGDSESVRVEADPPANTAAGTYEIVVTANGGGQSGSFVLSAEITGRPSVELVTTSGRLDLSGNAGDETETTVLVVNDGTAPLEEVRLSADEPADWTVTFEPDQIPLIGAGASEEVIVRITPSGDAVAGDYAIGVTARGEGETSEIAYRYTVATSRWWGAVGILIIVAALVLLLAVFRRFGRR